MPILRSENAHKNYRDYKPQTNNDFTNKTFTFKSSRGKSNIPQQFQFQHEPPSSSIQLKMENMVLIFIRQIMLVLVSFFLFSNWFMREKVFWIFEKVHKKVQKMLQNVSTFLMMLVIVQIIIFGVYHQQFQELKYKILYICLVTSKFLSTVQDYLLSMIPMI